MKLLWNSAFGLLIVAGSMLGLTLPFGKMATQGGVPGMLWAFIVSCGAGSVLMLLVLAFGRPFPLTPTRLLYFVLAAIMSYALPNFLLFTAISHLGAGYTGIMYTISPVITLVLSLVLGVRRPNALGIAGIIVGFAGALIVTLTRGEAGRPAEISWVLIGLLIPVCFAAGNIYRTYYWPPGAGPIELAAGSHLASAILLFGGVAVSGRIEAFALLPGMPLLVLAQIASASLMFAFFFRLQAVGGPVYLSQVGYVAAAIGLATGIIFLGERYQLLTWIGAAIIAVGVMMTTRAQVQPRELSSPPA
jgi:drug/metabolite transporter (DMT)-like permease